MQAQAERRWRIVLLATTRPAPQRLGYRTRHVRHQGRGRRPREEADRWQLAHDEKIPNAEGSVYGTAEVITPTNLPGRGAFGGRAWRGA